MMQIRKSKVEKEVIENLLQLGHSMKKISELNNVSRSCIERSIKRYGIILPEKTKDKRTCWKCKVEYPLTNDWFSNDKNDWLGFQKTCKVCQNANSKVYNENHKEYFAQKSKEKYKKEDNAARYQKYKPEYLKRRSEYSKTVRGKLFDLLNAAKGRAKKYNLELDIDIDFLINLCEQQNGKCFLTDIDFTFKNRESNNHFNPFNPSIDKIDSKKGYTKDNIRLVCVIVNLSLNEFGEKNFQTMCQAYINKSKSKQGEN